MKTRTMSLTVTAILFLSTNVLAGGPLEQNTEAFIQALAAKGGPPIYKLSIEEARKVLDSAQSGP
ncbi:MAG: hypothetical protein ACREOH_14885, partial [Candidatus Entotheonellia bacterium]